MNRRTIIELVKIKITGSITSMLNFMRGREAKGKGFNIGTAIIVGIIVIAFLMMIGFSFGVAMVLGFEMYTQGCLWLFFPMGFLCSAAFALIGTIFAAQSYLFDATDNELLLSMPIKPSYVLLSRMLALYVLNFIYSTIIFLPVGLAYGIFFHYDVVTFIYFIISLLMIPLLVTAVASIFGYLLGLVAHKIPNKNFLTVVFGLGMIAVLLVVGLNLGPIIRTLMDNIHIVANKVFDKSKVLYWYGLAMNSKLKWYERMITGVKYWGILPLMFICLLVSYFSYWFISKKFIKTITRKVVTKKKKYVEKPMKPSNIQLTLIRKEVGYFFSIPAYVMNAGMSTIMSIMLGVGILMRGNLIVEWLPRMFPDASSNLIALAVGSSLALCCTINDVTAPSISLEGKTLWLLKSTPIEPMKIFFGKALLAPLVSLPGVIFTAIASAVTLQLTAADILFIFFIPILACLFSGFLGICVNLRIPRFDWSSEITVIKQSLSVIFTLFLSMFFTAIPFVVAIVPAAFLERFSSVWAYGICIIYFFLLVLLEIFYLATDGQKIWKEL